MVAANTFLPEPFSEDVLLDGIIRMEGHPDNVIACYFGGLTASVYTEKGILHGKYKISPSLRIVLAVPSYEISTSDARNVLPSEIPLKDATFNLQRVPLLVDALTNGDFALLDELMRDRLHQPYRKRLIKGYDKIIECAREAGASGTALSGAGPTMAAFCSEDSAHDVATAMSSCMENLRISYQTLILSPDTRGVSVEKRF